jgi:DNA modification methylase
MGSKLAHENEAPFPEKLVEFFIRSFCPPGGVTVDCFSGSGTTAATAEQLGRKWVAIDIRQSQCDLTAKRIERIEKGLFDESNAEND